MSEASFPGPGPDGEQPPPVGPARDDDWDGDAEMAGRANPEAISESQIRREIERQGHS